MPAKRAARGAQEVHTSDAVDACRYFLAPPAAEALQASKSAPCHVDVDWLHHACKDGKPRKQRLALSRPGGCTLLLCVRYLQHSACPVRCYGIFAPDWRYRTL